jgi:hypothetical protein
VGPGAGEDLGAGRQGTAPREELDLLVGRPLGQARGCPVRGPRRVKNRLKLLQASQLASTIAGKGELAVVGGPVTRQAVRLRILFRHGPPIDLVPMEVGSQFPVKFYAVFYLQPAKTAWMPERVVAYDQAGRRIAECWATTGQGNVCDRPQGAPQPP